MEEKCKNCGEKSVSCIPFFAHENTMVHMSAANRRMFITVVCVCVTFILTIIIFTSAFTAREKAWLDTLSQIQQRQTTGVEVQDELYKQPDAGAHP